MPVSYSPILGLQYNMYWGIFVILSMSMYIHAGLIGLSCGWLQGHVDGRLIPLCLCCVSSIGAVLSVQCTWFWVHAPLSIPTHQGKRLAERANIIVVLTTIFLSKKSTVNAFNYSRDELMKCVQCGSLRHMIQLTLSNSSLVSILESFYPNYYSSEVYVL
jgi:hypothetical protein